MANSTNSATNNTQVQHWFWRGYFAIYRHIWSYIFGLPYLVYYVGASLNSITAEVSLVLTIYIINRLIDNIEQQV